MRAGLTKHDDANVSGNRIGNAITWAVSVLGAASPDVGESPAEPEGEQQHDEAREHVVRHALVGTEPDGDADDRHHDDHEDVAEDVGHAAAPPAPRCATSAAHGTAR